MKISIKDIALESGVSVMTVSRVFDPAKSHMVKKDTLQKVLAVAKKYDYHPVIAGRSFVTGRTYKVGIIHGSLRRDLGSPFFARFVEGLVDELQGSGYTLNILNLPDAKADNGEKLLDLLRSKVSDGYILSDSMILDSIRDALRGAPLLLTEDSGRVPAGIPHVVRDPRGAISDIWRLISEVRRKSVAILTLPIDTGTSRSGMIREYAPAGAEIAEFRLTYESDFFSDWRNTVVEVRRIFPELRKYEVIWCINDFCALGVVDVLRENGLIPGRDVCVVGHDNIEQMLAFCEPVLTTVDTCWGEVGRRAASAMLKILRNEPVSQEELTTRAQVVRRQSL
ncbi:MAG: LacI family DNA-binding transcriptional regulator [Lentisphaeria bacterium]|nr:LacI family DNA-binding transcriptional regulator [Lentisphaeria bacterium]